MKIDKDDIAKILTSFNPWWRNEGFSGLPHWRRAAFGELYNWIFSPPTHRAVLLSGARQVGKTTLILQVIEELLKQGVPKSNILYVTFDHPILKIGGIDAVLEVWREREPKKEGVEYLFLDEAQFIRDWGTWVKHQVDFDKDRRIVFTGSAMPIDIQQESGVGRWHTIRLTTLSFYEYLQLKFTKGLSSRYSFIEEYRSAMKEKKGADDLGELFETLTKEYYLKTLKILEAIPNIKSLRELFDWSASDFHRVSEIPSSFAGHFHEYLFRGGFPQTVQIESIEQAQKLLREDIIDKVLKRDMTAIFGTRHVLELERVFLYLCLHDGGLLDLQAIRENLEVERPTAERFIQLFEATHLAYRLQRFGYGKEVLRAKYKIYLADPAISAAVFLKGKSVLDDSQALGVATETAVFKHLFSRYYSQTVRFSYWQNKKKHEVDLIAEVGDKIIPFEVKYRAQHTGIRELKGLLEFCHEKNIERAYVMTKSLDDFGLMENTALGKTKIMRIPASLMCYWMGQAEFFRENVLD